MGSWGKGPENVGRKLPLWRIFWANFTKIENWEKEKKKKSFHKSEPDKRTEHDGDRPTKVSDHILKHLYTASLLRAQYTFPSAATSFQLVSRLQS